MLPPDALAFIGTSGLAGTLLGTSLPAAGLPRALERGVVLPGHVPLLHPDDPAPFPAADLLLLPDPATECLVPAADGPDLVLLIGDLLELDGAPWACCPRYFLRRALAALHAEFGLQIEAAVQQEFRGGIAAPGRSFRAVRAQAGALGSLLATMRANGLVPEVALPGDRPGAFEVSPAPAPGVAGADAAVLLRELVAAAVPGAGLGAARLRLGLRATDGQPAMDDAHGPLGLSDEAEHFVAGVMHHWPVLAAAAAPRAAAYRTGRWPSSELATEGRPGALRLRTEQTDEGAGVPVALELTCADAGASPFLALGATVWAGLDGLREHRRLAELERSAWPDTLAGATEAFAGSLAAAEWFGMELREQMLRFLRRSTAVRAARGGAD